MKNLKMIILLLLVFSGHLSALQDSIKQNDLSKGQQYFGQGIYQYTGDSTNQFHSDIDSAIHYMKLAYPMFKKEKDWEMYIECFSALSFFYHTNNEFDSFVEYAELAFSEAQKYLEPDNLKFGDIFNNLNAIYSRIGNNRKGIDLLNKSLEIRKKNNENDFQLSFGFQNLGTAYSRLGDTKKAIEYLSHSIKLRIESDSIPEYDILFADSYSIFADVYKLADDFENAIFYYKKSLNILNHSKSQKNQLALNLRVNALIEISEILIRTNQLEEAKPFLKSVFKLHDTGIEIQRPTSLYLRSLLNFKNKDSITALKDIKTSNLISDKDNNENSPPLIAKRYKLWGDILQKQNDLNAAINKYNEGLSILGLSSDKSQKNEIEYNAILAKPQALNLLLGKSKCLKSKAEISNTKESWLDCFINYLSAVKLIREIRSGIVTSESKNILSASSMEVYEQALDAAYNVLKFGRDKNVLQNVFEIIESNKALLLLESYNKQLALGVLDVPNEMLSEEYDLKVDLAYYAQELTLEKRKEKSDEKVISELETNYQVTSQKYDSLIFTLNELSPDFNKYKSQIAPLSITKLKEDLSKTKSTILEYFHGDDNLFLMIINSEKIEFLKLDNTNLLDQIETLKKELSFEASMSSGNKGFNDFIDLSNGLYSQLFSPAHPYLLEGQSNNIIIIPDGYISSIPFDILISGHKPDAEPSYSNDYLNYLIEDYNISYSYSASLFSKDQSSSSGEFSKELIAFAPDFEVENVTNERICECDAIQLQKLNCNVEESEKVANLFSGKVYTKKFANKKAFLNEAKNYKIIHIASHACIDQEDGMLNQIFLSDSSLTNFEIYSSRLNAEMTVLSACNTGIGEIQNGEGVLNLAKGFLMAGSKSALMSLWSVNDCTTSTLMESFYSNLKNGSSRNIAMRDAKINFLNNANKLNQHPYYWGAFVHYGKDKPLQVRSTLSMFHWILISILIIGLTTFLLRRNKKKEV